MRGNQVDLARQLLVARLDHLVQQGREAKDQLSAALLLHGIGVTILNCRDALVLEVQGQVAAMVLQRISTEPLGQVVREAVDRMSQDHCCYQPDGNDFRHGIATTTLVAHGELANLLAGYLIRLDSALAVESAEDAPWTTG